MSRREEFDNAIKVIQRALQDGIVTMGLTRTPRDSDAIVTEIIVNKYGEPKATFYHEKVDSYGSEQTVRGTQSNFSLGIMEENVLTERRLKESKRKYEDMLKKTADDAKRLSDGKQELSKLQDEILSLEGKK